MDTVPWHLALEGLSLDRPGDTGEGIRVAVEKPDRPRDHPLGRAARAHAERTHPLSDSAPTENALGLGLEQHGNTSKTSGRNRGRGSMLGP